MTNPFAPEPSTPTQPVTAPATPSTPDVPAIPAPATSRTPDAPATPNTPDAPATPAPATPSTPDVPALEFPKDINDYKLERPQIPEGAYYNEELEQLFIKSSFESKIPPEQAKNILNEVSQYFFNAQKQQIDAQKANAQKLDNDLKSLWGINTEANKKIAQNAAKQFGITDTQADKMATLLGDAELLQAFHKIGLSLSEDSFVGTGSSSGISNKERLESELKALKDDKDYSNIMNNKGHHKHNDLKNKVNELNKKLAAFEAQ